MKYRELGRTGWKVSEISFGAVVRRHDEENPRDLRRTDSPARASL